MEVIPAIDIRGGRCVRLFQGDYDRETVFSDSPVDMAAHLVRLGAERLHVVDLDGARKGRAPNIEIVFQIAESSPVPVQYGGGIRDVDSALRAVEMGVNRVVVSTAAVEDPCLVVSLLREIGAGALVVSVDARGGRVALGGWVRESGVGAVDFARQLESTGIERVVYTDISRDGTLTEPNFAGVEEMAAATGMKVLVAGGVSSVEHVSRLAAVPVEGAIIGAAVYTGTIDLSKAIAAAGGTRSH